MNKTAVIASISGLGAVIVALLVMAYGDQITSGGLAAIGGAFDKGSDYEEEVITELRNVYQTVDLTNKDIDTSTDDLNKDGHVDLIVKIVHDGVCGSAGCPYELFITSEAGWEQLTFGFSGESLNVLESITNGYKDLELNGVRFSWDGARYVPVQ